MGSSVEAALGHLLAIGATRLDVGPACPGAIVFADVDGNGADDIFITHLTREKATLFANLGRGQFEDRSAGVGLSATIGAFVAATFIPGRTLIKPLMTTRSPGLSPESMVRRPSKRRPITTGRYSTASQKITRLSPPLSAFPRWR